MTLYEYLSKYPQQKIEFARKLRIAESTLYKYINQEREPRLPIAIRIHKLTGGLVGYAEMLTDPEDAEIIVDDEDLL